MMKQKNIVVTGGAQGIGKSACKLLNDNGYKIFAFDNDEEALLELEGEFPEVEIVFGDVSDEKAVSGLMHNFEKQVFSGL